MSRHLSLDEYREDPARDNAIAEASLYCNGCGKSFTPTELTMQKDDWCICDYCAKQIAGFNEGRI